MTGAGTGIDRASSIVFAREGAKVVVADVAVRTGEETVRLIQEAGGEAVIFAVDVACSDQVAALMEKALATFGRLDVAHNNVGVEGPVARIVDRSLPRTERRGRPLLPRP